MTIVSRATLALLFATVAIAPATAQIGAVDTSKLKPASSYAPSAPAKIFKAEPLPIITAKQAAALPKKMVNGQQFVVFNGKLCNLVASGAGNFQLVASGAGN